jgi:IS30 family transposase
LVKLLSKYTDDTAVAMIEALKGLRVHTITYDNGLEFTGHQQVSDALDATGYFCKPYHSWDKTGALTLYPGTGSKKPSYSLPQFFLSWFESG